MEKAQVEHDERLEKHPTVEALPQAAKAEAGVLLSVEQPGDSALRLAKDGHVRFFSPFASVHLDAQYFY